MKYLKWYMFAWIIMASFMSIGFMFEPEIGAQTYWQALAAGSAPFALVGAIHLMIWSAGYQKPIKSPTFKGNADRYLSGSEPEMSLKDIEKYFKEILGPDFSNNTWTVVEFKQPEQQKQPKPQVKKPTHIPKTHTLH